MNIINIDDVYKFVQEHINDFHDSKLKSLSSTKLKDLLKKKNPYLFKAKYIITAEELVRSLLDAKISSSEEEIFGRFLEELAIFVAEKTLNASKSSSQGIVNKFTKEFIDEFCDESGKILWEKIVEFNSKNLIEDKMENYDKINY